MPVLIAIGASVGIKLVYAGLGALGHWLIGKHTRKSAVAAAAINAVAAGVNAVPPTVLVPTKSTSAK